MTKDTFLVIGQPTDSTPVGDNYTGVSISGAGASATGSIDLRGYEQANVYLVASAAAGAGAGVQYQQSPDGVNWTAAANFSPTLSANSVSTKIASISNPGFLRLVMGTAAAADSITGAVLVSPR